MSKTITSANNTVILNIPGVFGNPIELDKWAADDAFTVEGITTGEVMQGVDGKISRGWVPSLRVFAFTLMADSSSCVDMDTLNSAQQAIKEFYSIAATIYMPGPGIQYNCRAGILTKYSPMAEAKKVLQPRKFEITFGRMDPAPMPPYV
jgi:hypothetical protein